MFEFIFTFLGVLFLVWLLEAVWKIVRTYRQMNKTFKETTGQSFNSFRKNARSGFRSYSSDGSSTGGRQSKRRSRIIPAEYGEYVDFVETKAESVGSSDSYDTPRQSQTYGESQISDAEWEEIK